MRTRRLLAITILLCGAAACELRPPSVTTTVEGPATLAVGATAQLTATIVPTGNSPTAPSPVSKIEWSSSDAARATVSASGLVTGIAPGPVTIYALPVPFELGSMGRLNITIVQ